MADGELRRRERKKQQTRARMVRAALDLFVERGYDEVTIGEIAEAADVYPTTFFRHFGSKEGVLLTERELVLSRFGALIAAQPVSMGLRDAVVAAFASLLDDLDLDPEEERLRARLANDSVAVRSVVLGALEDVRVAVRDAVKSRLASTDDHDPQPDVIAAVVVASLAWVRGPALESEDLSSERVLRLFDEALGSVAGLAAKPAG